MLLDLSPVPSGLRGLGSVLVRCRWCDWRRLDVPHTIFVDGEQLLGVTPVREGGGQVAVVVDPLDDDRPVSCHQLVAPFHFGDELPRGLLTGHLLVEHARDGVGRAPLTVVVVLPLVIVDPFANTVPPPVALAGTAGAPARLFLALLGSLTLLATQPRPRRALLSHLILLLTLAIHAH